jgi:molybdopterin-containing oxidoreductase family iron-sulfur binding subunit
MKLRMKRRDFLKVMGWSGAGAALAACDRPSYIASREGREYVVPYVVPEEFVVPGIGVHYASTCLQCPSGCGVHARVREGRVLKLEGNPDSPVNRGKLCAMGQAAVQTHYNPDRLTTPRVRKGDRFEDTTWADALALLREKIGPASGLKGDRLAWMSGAVSGHQAVLLAAFLESVGSTHHYVYEAVNDAMWRAVCRDMLGQESPRLRLEKARVVLSFGADFLGTWGAPVANSVRYAEFRNSPRGVLIQAEPKMTVTGANADLWVPVRPGTEGVLALGIANALNARHGRSLAMLPAGVQAQIGAYPPAKASAITGTSEQHIERIADLLNERSPSLVLAGAAAGGHESGYDNVAAAMMLNLILGNVGQTLEPASFPVPQLAPRQGDSRSVVEFAKALGEKRFDVVFFSGANPLFTASPALALRERLAAVPFKVALTCFEDETSLQADLVLPLYSALEDWGTHVPAAQPERAFITIQQPVMEPLYAETRGFGDTLLALLKLRGSAAHAGYDDYYSYLRHAFATLPPSVKGGMDDNTFWNAVLQKGILEVGTASGGRLSARPVAFQVKEPPRNDARPYFLAPSASSVMWDGRHANVPWMQELPDPISKAVWDSWAEMHPSTAAKLGGLRTGDIVSISSEHGAIQTRVYIYKGMHPDAIAVPIGQGHEAYGRYAKGRGVNPLSIVTAATDGRSGELAQHATPVAVALVARRPDRVETAGTDRLVVMGGSESQLGRKLVVTVSAERFERTEGRRT